MDRSQISSLADELSAELTLPVADKYFFLLRIGNNWRDYPFDWDAFVELAAALEERSLERPSGASSPLTPVVVVSLDSAEPSPTAEPFSAPAPHLRIVVSPDTAVALLAETWLSAIARQIGPSDGIASTSFLARLGLEPSQLSPLSSSVLSSPRTSGERPRSLTLSGSVREIAHSFGTAECSAVQIAAAVAQRHPEYAGDRLGNASPQTAPNLPNRPWQAWLDAVGGVFDMEAVARSRHQVVDGRLLLVGVALADPTLLAELDRAGVWSPLLFEIDETAAPTGPAHDVLVSLRFAHGYVSDVPGGKDRLGIQGEVTALCDVITDPNVLPPLAVGLFGEWGSGKSFFMEKMREHIDGKRAEFDSISRSIVQIRFNAWHYSDASLWASLAMTIFERLADPEPVSLDARRTWLTAQGDPKRAQREGLLRQLETYRAARAEKDAEADRLRAERALVKGKRKDAELRRKQAAEGATLTEVVRAVKCDERVTDALTGLSDALGFTPAIHDLTQLNRELQTTSGYLLATWRKVRHKSLAALLASVAVLLGLVTIALVARNGPVDLGPIVTAFATVATVTGGVAKVAHPAATVVNRAVAQLQVAIDVTAEVEDRLRTTRMRDELELKARLDGLNREVDKATADIADLDEKIAAVKASVGALSVERQLYDFLSDRAAGYQRHQGIVGMLHHDFQLLEAKLLAQQSSLERDPKLPKIDRIVLYVDDLDRCQPAKVLDVLEAVHLLLALELFVVVVGVDPRWLQRSLRHQYRELLSGNVPNVDGYLRSMPVEYLEKIFQIPLTLPAMDSQGYANLIAGLAPSVPVAPFEPTMAIHETERHRTSGAELSGGIRTPTRAPLTDSASPPDTPDPTPIDLTPAEVQFAQQLGRLVDSPRAAKRLINTYRLIRATQHVGTRSRFLGSDGRPGEYIALLTLLAVAAGYPTVLDRLLAALEHDAAGIRTWTEFVAQLVLGSDPGLRGKLAPPDLSSGSATDPEAAAWTNLQKALAANARTSGVVDDIQTYRKWGPLVARFSFTI